MTDQGSLMAEMERTWNELTRMGVKAPSAIILPKHCFERVRQRRLGRRLIQGRWRVKPQIRYEISPWWGSGPVARATRIGTNP